MIPGPQSHSRRGKARCADFGRIRAMLAREVIGQPEAISTLAPLVQMFQAGLSPDDGPAGALLLLGPTGAGKTQTARTLARALHGDPKRMIRIDCGEYQMDHEVAKLIGAPPGYLGHTETRPALSRSALDAAVTPECALAVVLFDEIEKAAPSLIRLLLGVLDSGDLRLGDNSVVDFRRTIVLFTSNLGAREMGRAMRPEFGFHADARSSVPPPGRMAAIAAAAAKKRLPPEFLNRLDGLVTYRPLSAEAFSSILDLRLEEWTARIAARPGLGLRRVTVSTDAKAYLLRRGVSTEYGARELNRVIRRELVQPLVEAAVQGAIAPGGEARAAVSDGAIRWSFARSPEKCAERPVALLVDGNRDVLACLERRLAAAGLHPMIAASAAAARRLLSETAPDAALVDYLLPDGNGVALASTIRRAFPASPVSLLCGAPVPPEEEALCLRDGIVIMRKPLLASAAAEWIHARYARSRPEARPAPPPAPPL